MFCEKLIAVVKRYSTVPGAVVVFALVWLLMLALHAGAEGAAWMQAIGSIVAVGIAVAVPVSLRKIDKEEQRHAAMREDHQKALIALRAMLEVEEVLIDVLKAGVGQGRPWHDVAYYETRIKLVQLRVTDLLARERNGSWWNAMVDAQTLLADLGAAIRVVGLGEHKLYIRFYQSLIDWQAKIKAARNSLRKVEENYGSILFKGHWNDDA